MKLQLHTSAGVIYYTEQDKNPLPNWLRLPVVIAV